MKYRKTALIEATQWFPGGPPVEGVCCCSLGYRPGFSSGLSNGPGPRAPHVHTREGVLAVAPGDWIATGVQGEKWPIKPDIFAASYEPVP